MDGTFIWGIIGGIFLISIVIDNSLLRREIERANLTLDKIAKHIGVFDASIEKIDDEIKSLIAEGKRIRAVKRYRMVTGLGLKESKKYVDSLIKNESKKVKFKDDK